MAIRRNVGSAIRGLCRSKVSAMTYRIVLGDYNKDKLSMMRIVCCSTRHLHGNELRELINDIDKVTPNLLPIVFERHGGLISGRNEGGHHTTGYRISNDVRDNLLRNLCRKYSANDLPKSFALFQAGWTLPKEFHVNTMMVQYETGNYGNLFDADDVLYSNISFLSNVIRNPVVNV